MKKSFMTRVLATGLSVAMAFSLSTATSLVTAEAAVPTLVDAVTGGSGKAVTVNVDDVAKLKINPNVSKTYSVASVKKSSKKIKTAVSKNGTVVYVRGVAATGEKDSAIRVSFKAKKTGKTSKFTFAAKVKVVEKEEEKPAVKVAELKDVVQTYSNKFDVTLSTEVESAKASDFSMVRDSDNVVIVIKDAKLNDKDKTKVTLETYNGLKDGKEYTVSYTASDEAKTKTEKKVTVTAGKVEALDVTPLTIPAKRATKVKVQTIDANGVILSEDDFSSLSDSKLECTVTPAVGGNIDNNKLYLAKEGDEATVEVKYHTGVYENGVETVLTKKVTVTASADTTVIDKFQLTIGTAAPAWDASNFKAKNVVDVANPNLKAYIRIKDSNGDEISTADYSNYKVASTDPTKLVVNGSDITSKYVSVLGVNPGTAYITITKDSSVVATLPVSVVATAKATSASLSNSVISIQKGGSVNASTSLTVKDQYTNWFNDHIVSAIVKVADAPLNAPAGVQKGNHLAAGNSYVGSGNNVDYVVTASAFTVAGSYKFEISTTTKNDDNTTSSVVATLVVNVVDTTGVATSQALKIGSQAINTTITNDTAAKNLTTTIGIAQMKNGVVVGYDQIKDLKILYGNDVIFNLVSGGGVGSPKIKTHAAINNAVYASSFSGIQNADKTVTLTVNKYAGGKFTKNLKAGNYIVVASDMAGKEYTSTFTVSDSQGTATVTVKSNDAQNLFTLTSFMNPYNDKVAYSYEGLAVMNTPSYIDAAGTDRLYTVKGFTLEVTVPGTHNYKVDVWVSQTFYVNNTTGK